MKKSPSKWTFHHEFSDLLLCDWIFSSASLCPQCSFLTLFWMARKWKKCIFGIPILIFHETMVLASPCTTWNHHVKHGHHQKYRNIISYNLNDNADLFVCSNNMGEQSPLPNIRVWVWNNLVMCCLLCQLSGAVQLPFPVFRADQVLPVNVLQQNCVCTKEVNQIIDHEMASSFFLRWSTMANHYKQKHCS